MNYGQAPRAPRDPGYGGPGYGGTRKMEVPVPDERYGVPPQAPPHQPPHQPPPGRPYPPGDGGPPPPGQRPRKRGRVKRTLLIIFLVVVLFFGGIWLYLELALNRVDAIGDYPGRPAAASGTNWLIVGSDSRANLSAEEKKELSTGDTSSELTDTILVAHLPDNDVKPTLMSLPRDTCLTQSLGCSASDKINAVYQNGGPAKLVRTVEEQTGLRIDHYAEISFGGFAGIVDAIGGVEMTIKQTIHDNETGVTIKKGKRELNGKQALAFVRTRKSDATPRSDLDRVANQRKFIGALAGEVASPGTLLNPFDLFPLLGSAPDALTVDSGDHLHNLAGLGFAMRGVSDGGTVTTTVPVTNGSAEVWDPDKSQRLFTALREDTPVPKDVIYK